MLFPSVTLDSNFSRLPAILMIDVIKGLATWFVKMANKPKSKTISGGMTSLAFKVLSSPVNNSFLG